MTQLHVAPELQDTKTFSIVICFCCCRLLAAWEFSPPETPTLRTRKKKRLTQTAPANLQKSAQSRPAKEVTQSVEPEPAQKQQPPEPPNMGSRKQSMYLHLPAQGKQASDEDTGMGVRKLPRKPLPKPNPKTLLDVMMGLNAFSHVPPPRCKSTELVRSDSRQSAGSRLSSYRDSLDDSQENVAESFMKHWKTTIAERRQSIVDKLAAAQRPFSESRLGNRPVSTLESVPETRSSQQFTRRSKSKWNIHQNMVTPSLPVISQDDDERVETFQAWMEEKKEEIKSNRTNPAYVNPALDRVKERRKSFLHWLDKRGNLQNYDTASEDDVQEVREPEIRARPPPPVREGKEKIDIGQMLGTIMQIKTRFRDPVDKRLKKFYSKLDDIKARDDEARIGPRTAKEKRRRWKMLMKGIDAALADSSDEEDDHIHTV